MPERRRPKKIGDDEDDEDESDEDDDNDDEDEDEENEEDGFDASDVLANVFRGKNEGEIKKKVQTLKSKIKGFKKEKDMPDRDPTLNELLLYLTNGLISERSVTAAEKPMLENQWGACIFLHMNAGQLLPQGTQTYQ